jgi:hypothetical protein
LAEKLLDHPVKGLQNYGEMIRLLTEAKGIRELREDLFGWRIALLQE